MCMELLTYLPLGLIIDVSTCMDNITFKIRLQYGSYQISTQAYAYVWFKSSLANDASMKHYTTCNKVSTCPRAHLESNLVPSSSVPT